MHVSVVQICVTMRQFTALNWSCCGMYPVRRIASKRFTGAVAAACGRDESGIIGLVLWGEQTERIQVGDIICLTNGWCRRRNGELVISTGMDGSLVVLDR